MKKNLFKLTILFIIGGSTYSLIEHIFKSFSQGNTHWTMFLLGGLCFILLGGLNEYIPWDMSLRAQALIGSIIVTSLELIFGIYLNLYLGLNIWNYSNLPFNFLGQICLPFSIAWLFLGLLAIILDDFLRYFLFGEEFPHYKF